MRNSIKARKAKAKKKGAFGILKAPFIRFLTWQ